MLKLSPSGARVYGNYVGGRYPDIPWGIAVDSNGSAYINGYTYSDDLPVKNAFQETLRQNGPDGFVAKLLPSGSDLVYMTYLGGTGDDVPYGLAVDPSGCAYVAGFTTSTDFPTAGAIQGAKVGRSDGFVAKVGSSGSNLVYSTYLGGGGDDYVSAVAVDLSGNAFMVGKTKSSDFPVVAPFQQQSTGNGDVFITRINPAGAALVFSSLLGGPGIDEGYYVAVDPGSVMYATGFTYSADFPVKQAAQSSFAGGGRDAFIFKVAPDATDTQLSLFPAARLPQLRRTGARRERVHGRGRRQSPYRTGDPEVFGLRRRGESSFRGGDDEPG